MEPNKTQSRPRIDLVEKINWLAMVEAEKKLSSTAKVVASRLALGHLNNDSLRCDPSMPTLAAGIGRGQRVVAEALAELRDAGWIEWTLGRFGRNNYVLLRGPFEAANDWPLAEDRSPTPAEDRKPPLRRTARVPLRKTASKPVISTGNEPVSLNQGSPSGLVRQDEREGAVGRGKISEVVSVPTLAGFDLTGPRRTAATTAGLPDNQVDAAFREYVGFEQAKGRTYSDAGWAMWCQRRVAMGVTRSPAKCLPHAKMRAEKTDWGRFQIPTPRDRQTAWAGKHLGLTFGEFDRLAQAFPALDLAVALDAFDADPEAQRRDRFQNKAHISDFLAGQMPRAA